MRNNIFDLFSTQKVFANYRYNLLIFCIIHYNSQFWFLIFSLVLGGLLGEAINIEEKMDSLVGGVITTPSHTLG